MAAEGDAPLRGWEFLMLPGPSNVPDRVLRALARPVIDHRGPEFKRMVRQLLPQLQRAFQAEKSAMVVFPGSGTGGWEAALTNVCSPGDVVLDFDSGHFAAQWRRLATKLGLKVRSLGGDWGQPASADELRRVLVADGGRSIRAVCVVHNETSTGCVADVRALRQAIDQAGRECLLLVDSVSGLGSVPYRHDEWGVDVTVCASQKGLMLPPGLAFNAISEKALRASKEAKCARAYWDWQPHLAAAASGTFPYTLPTNLLYGLGEALAMLEEEGLEAAWGRHERLAAACRATVSHWGLETVCAAEGRHSPVVTAVRLPSGHDADAVRAVALRRYGLVLGNGLGRLQGQVLRIGHLGAVNDLMLLAALAGVEMALRAVGVPHRPGGVQAAIERLSAEPLPTAAPRL
eukprot:TRINITY_DN12875_c0_g2_i1.p1 TRINITY_DN12875_c0_g2~~TRINITY_DN12875_c0_g2_i1.p1  ORF type:complete len:420 (+),score=146.72 TRINITY_DN12875_c0_g2_i1:50-1261(+)